MEYSSPIKENEIKPFATTWVDLESITLTRQKKTICRIKNKTGEYNKKETDPDIENKLVVTSEERKWEVEDRSRGLRDKTTIYKISYRVILYRMGL